MFSLVFCSGLEFIWGIGFLEIRSSLEFDTELSWILGDFLFVGS